MQVLNDLICVVIINYDIETEGFWLLDVRVVPNLVFFHFILGFRGQHVDPEELFRNIFGDNFNFKNFSESDEFESTQYGFAQAQEVWKTSQ